MADVPATVTKTRWSMRLNNGLYHLRVEGDEADRRVVFAYLRYHWAKVNSPYFGMMVEDYCKLAGLRVAITPEAKWPWDWIANRILIAGLRWVWRQEGPGVFEEDLNGGKDQGPREDAQGASGDSASAQSKEAPAEDRGAQAAEGATDPAPTDGRA